MQDRHTATDDPDVLPQGGPLGGALFAAALELSPHATLFLTNDVLPRAIWGNVQAHRLLGVEEGQLLHWSRFPPVLAAAHRELLDAGGGFTTTGISERGEPTSAVRVSMYPDAGLSSLFIVHLEERTEAQHEAGERQVSAARFRAVAQQGPVGILASEVGLRVAFANEQACDLLGRAADDVRALGWLEAIDREHLDAVTEALSAVFDGTATSVQFRLARTDRWVNMVAGPVQGVEQGTGFVVTLEDVTLARDHRAELQHQANHDQLTGLSNRGALLAALERARDERGSSTHALLFFDLDHFKFVNDALGQAVGDRLLTEIAGRFRQRIRSDDVLARFGGDEFVLLCHDLSGG